MDEDYVGLDAFLGCLVVGVCRMSLVVNWVSLKIVKYFKLDNNDEFILSFIHSINKRPVYEYIKNMNGHLVVYKARYDAFGAGMPETSSGNIKIHMKENSIIELTGIDRQIDDFSVFVVSGLAA